MTDSTQSTQMLKSEMVKWWWLPLIQGIAAFALAFALWSTPVKTLISITYWLGFFWMFDGAVNIVRSSTGSTGQSRLWLFLVGIIGLIAGAFLLMNPTLTSVVSFNVMVSLFAISMLVNGVILALFGRSVDDGSRRRSWGSFFIGLLYALGGCLLLANPSLTAVTLLYFFVFWAIFVGLGLIMLAFELKSLGK